MYHVNKRWEGLSKHSGFQRKAAFTVSNNNVVVSFASISGYIPRRLEAEATHRLLNSSCFVPASSHVRRRNAAQPKIEHFETLARK